MNNFNYVATIWPTTMDSKTFNESICRLKNACLGQYYEKGKPVRYKVCGSNHMVIKLEGAVTIIVK